MQHFLQSKQRRLRRAALALLAGAVIICGVIAMLGTTSGRNALAQSGSGNIQVPPEWAKAPKYPFRGAIKVESRSNDGTDESVIYLQYWDDERAALHSVFMGQVSVTCANEPSVSDSGVMYTHFNDMGASSHFGIPWGDTAYPLYWTPNEMLADPFPEWLQAQVMATVDSPTRGSWLALSIGEHTAWFDLENRDKLTLVNHPGSEVDYRGASELRELYGGFFAGFGGTDGRNFAIRLYSGVESPCDDYSYIFDGISGDVVACGWSVGGPVLWDQTMEADESSFVLPEPPVDLECNPVNLSLWTGPQ